jgi:hypothetical protein
MVAAVVVLLVVLANDLALSLLSVAVWIGGAILLARRGRGDRRAT